MKPEKGLTIVGGVLGAVVGCTIGIVTVSMSEKIAALEPWKKALLVVGMASGAGLLSGVLLYAMYGPVTAAMRG